MCDLIQFRIHSSSFVLLHWRHNFEVYGSRQMVAVVFLPLSFLISSGRKQKDITCWHMRNYHQSLEYILLHTKF